MANEYSDLATLKLALGISNDTTRDPLMTAALSAASRGIDRATSRRFWLDPVATVRTYNPRGRVVATRDGDRLLVDDIGTTTGIVVEIGTTSGGWTAVTDYETYPDNAIADTEPVTGLLRTLSSWPSNGRERVRVTARFGWPAVPAEVIEATIIQAARLYTRKDSPEGVTGSSEWGVIRLSRIDPDVQALIQHLTVPGFA